MKCGLVAIPRSLSLSLTDGNDLLVGNRYDLAVPLPPKRPLGAQLAHWFVGRFLK